MAITIVAVGTVYSITVICLLQVHHTVSPYREGADSYLLQVRH